MLFRRPSQSEELCEHWLAKGILQTKPHTIQKHGRSLLCAQQRAKKTADTHERNDQRLDSGGVIIEEPIAKVSKEQDAGDLPNIVAEEETSHRRDDNEEQGIVAAVSAFDGNGSGTIIHGQHEKERKRVKMDASTKDLKSLGATRRWPNIMSNAQQPREKIREKNAMKERLDFVQNS